MENKYVALKIYYNFDWVVILRTLERYGYKWISGDKLTEVHQGIRQGTLFLNPNLKQIMFSHDPESTSAYCNFYIKVQ